MDDRALIETVLEEMKELRKEVREDMAMHKRALYGDEPNKTPGLIQLRALDDGRINKLEEFKKRITWIWGGVVTAAVGGWELAGDHIKGLFK